MALSLFEANTKGQQTWLLNYLIINCPLKEVILLLPRSMLKTLTLALMAIKFRNFA